MLNIPLGTGLQHPPYLIVELFLELITLMFQYPWKSVPAEQLYPAANHSEQVASSCTSIVRIVDTKVLLRDQ